MRKCFLLITIVLLVACAPSPQAVQTAIAQTQAVWTPIPIYTPQPTYTLQLTYTPQPTIVVTRVVVQTPAPRNQYSCKPLTNMDYSDNSKIGILLQAYVSQLPDVKSVSYTIPEKLYINTLSQLYFVNYTSTDGKTYSKRYIVYLNEFGWQNATFSIDGQCWIDPPH